MPLNFTKLFEGQSATQVPKVPRIDLDYRPRDYFWATDLKLQLTSSIAGEARRQLVRDLVTSNAPIPNGLDAAVLDETTRWLWGRICPSNMGGEYSPPLRKGEVEIARISLESVTADQISVRARRVGRRIGYCVVDEYPDASTYVCHPASSVSPLSGRVDCTNGSGVGRRQHHLPDTGDERASPISTSQVCDVHHRDLRFLR